MIKKTLPKSKCVVALATMIMFIGTSLQLPSYAQVISPVNNLSLLPLPGMMVHPSPGFHPPVVRGIKLFPDDPFSFDFIIDTGDDKIAGDQLKRESEKLIKYFLTSLTVPDDDIWVNLSPGESDRIIPNNFGVTEMGRDLLAQDYLLKQLTASLMYPKEELGEKFWNNIREKAFEKFGTTDIPMDTFNKVWIVPEHALVYEFDEMVPTRQHDDGRNSDLRQERNVGAFVIESRLKVMLDQDYFVEQHNQSPGHQVTKSPAASDELTQEIIRAIILPEIEKEVNEGKNFAPLRQIYHSLVLATWFKRNLKESVLGKLYLDENKVAGVDIEDKDIKHKIYDQYMQAFKQGVYNYIQEDYDPATKKVIPRQYFSGGFELGDQWHDPSIVEEQSVSPASAVRAAQDVSDDLAKTHVRLDAVSKDGEQTRIAGSDEAMVSLHDQGTESYAVSSLLKTFTPQDYNNFNGTRILDPSILKKIIKSVDGEIDISGNSELDAASEEIRELDFIFLSRGVLEDILEEHGIDINVGTFYRFLRILPVIHVLRQEIGGGLLKQDLPDDFFHELSDITMLMSRSSKVRDIFTYHRNPIDGEVAEDIVIAMRKARLMSVFEYYLTDEDVASERFRAGLASLAKIPFEHINEELVDDLIILPMFLNIKNHTLAQMVEEIRLLPLTLEYFPLMNLRYDFEHVQPFLADVAEQIYFNRDAYEITSKRIIDLAKKHGLKLRGGVVTKIIVSLRRQKILPALYKNLSWLRPRVLVDMAEIILSGGLVQSAYEYTLKKRALSKQDLKAVQAINISFLRMMLLENFPDLDGDESYDLAIRIFTENLPPQKVLSKYYQTSDQNLREKVKRIEQFIRRTALYREIKQKALWIHPFKLQKITKRIINGVEPVRLVFYTALGPEKYARIHKSVFDSAFKHGIKGFWSLKLRFLDENESERLADKIIRRERDYRVHVRKVEGIHLYPNKRDALVQYIGRDKLADLITLHFPEIDPVKMRELFNDIFRNRTVVDAVNRLGLDGIKGRYDDSLFWMEKYAQKQRLIDELSRVTDLRVVDIVKIVLYLLDQPDPVTLSDAIQYKGVEAPDFIDKQQELTEFHHMLSESRRLYNKAQDDLAPNRTAYKKQNLGPGSVAQKDTGDQAMVSGQAVLRSAAIEGHDSVSDYDPSLLDSYTIYSAPVRGGGHIDFGSIPLLKDFEFVGPITDKSLSPYVFEDNKTGELFFVYPWHGEEKGRLEEEVFQQAQEIGFDNLLESRLITGIVNPDGIRIEDYTGGGVYAGRKVFDRMFMDPLKSGDRPTISLIRIAQTLTDNEILSKHSKVEDVFLTMLYFFNFDHIFPVKNLHVRRIYGMNRFMLYDYVNFDGEGTRVWGIQNELGDEDREEFADRFENQSLDADYIQERIDELRISPEQKQLLHFETKNVLSIISNRKQERAPTGISVGGIFSDQAMVSGQGRAPITFEQEMFFGDIVNRKLQDWQVGEYPFVAMDYNSEDKIIFQALQEKDDDEISLEQYRKHEEDQILAFFEQPGSKVVGTLIAPATSGKTALLKKIAAHHPEIVFIDLVEYYYRRVINKSSSFDFLVNRIGDRTKVILDEYYVKPFPGLIQALLDHGVQHILLARGGKGSIKDKRQYFQNHPEFPVPLDQMIAMGIKPLNRRQIEELLTSEKVAEYKGSKLSPAEIENIKKNQERILTLSEEIPIVPAVIKPIYKYIQDEGTPEQWTDYIKHALKSVDRGFIYSLTEFHDVTGADATLYGDLADSIIAPSRDESMVSGQEDGHALNQPALSEPLAASRGVVFMRYSDLTDEQRRDFEKAAKTWIDYEDTKGSLFFVDQFGNLPWAKEVPHINAIVAFKDGKPVGALNYRVSAYWDASSMDLRDDIDENGLYVIQDERQQRIGLQLNFQLFNFLKEEGADIKWVNYEFGRHDSIQGLAREMVALLRERGSVIKVYEYDDGKIDMVDIDFNTYTPIALDDVLTFGKEKERGEGLEEGRANNGVKDETMPGGIDLNPQKIDLQTTGEGIKTRPSISIDQLESIQIDGFVPVIMNIVPVTNLFLQLGVMDDEKESQETASPAVEREPADDRTTWINVREEELVGV